MRRLAALPSSSDGTASTSSGALRGIHLDTNFDRGFPAQDTRMTRPG